MNTRMRLTYKLIGTGWSECLIEGPDTSIEVSASYLSDALGNLVLSAISVSSGFHAVEFGFDEEPGEYRWSISTVDNNTIRLRVLEFSELWGNKPTGSGHLLTEFTTTPLAYAKAVEACASAVLHEYGIKGYGEKWAEHPFPAQALELLQAAIARREQ
jgi:hypothetical protein